MIGRDIYRKDDGRARCWRELAAEHLQGGGLEPMNMKNSPCVNRAAAYNWLLPPHHVSNSGLDISDSGGCIWLGL